MLPTLIGLAGMALGLLAYGLLTSGRLRAASPAYLLLNLAASGGLLVSLMADWNLPSVVANSIWASVSLIGLARWAWLGRRA